MDYQEIGQKFGCRGLAGEERRRLADYHQRSDFALTYGTRQGVKGEAGLFWDGLGPQGLEGSARLFTGHGNGTRKQMGHATHVPRPLDVGPGAEGIQSGAVGSEGACDEG